ncbi:glucokinase [Legionella shakespearei]|uniref:Glucokinase n=1 Tax=Legionella shakespearei DSM 23087 TaxID=1122169 RepID=A0A0W0Z9U1_9GAMM|nr:glucokinase [Legionella shakespearei]KTD65857.1 glucokinase [Legionella shakespearei DSM 23087]
MMHDDLKHYAIVADIGGTFARFARVNLLNLHRDKIAIYTCADFASIESVFMAYQSTHALKEITQAAIAIACPVLDDCICMTNCHWQFSVKALKNNLNLSRLQVLNDFNAIAMSIPALAQDEQLQIGNGYVCTAKMKVVLGAGTGLGVASLACNQGIYTAYAGEGGHADWGAKTEQEWFIYTFLKNKYTHVSYERLLSGHGLENLYQAIAAYQQQERPALKAAEIIRLAVSQECSIARDAVSQFFASLGTYAGDLALTFGAFGGVYIAGGIVPRLLSLMPHSEFRTRFEDKGRFSDFNALIPTFVITADQPGILGAALNLKQSLIGEYDVVS